MKRAIVIVVLVILAVGITLYVLNSAHFRKLLIERINQYLKVEISVPAVNPGARLLLLENCQRIELRANAWLPQPGTLGVRTRKEELQWSASAGRLSVRSGVTNNVWWPPAASTLTIIRTDYRGWFERFPETLLWGSVVVEKSCEVSVLPATPLHLLRDGVIDGFTIGEYLDPRSTATLQRYGDEAVWIRLYPEAYLPPDGFYKVTVENKDLPISKHFTLGTFAMDYPWYSLGFPQYIALDYGLVEKLEALIALMEADGYPASNFALIYGFRSPAFNLGTMEEDHEYTLKVPFSLHQYGKAVDLLIDHNHDLVMDDLNGDGRVDIHDAAVIMHYVNILDRRYREKGSRLVGGAGLYERHDFRGRVQSPYIHIDVRGFTNERGQLIRWPGFWPDGTRIRFGQI